MFGMINIWGVVIAAVSTLVVGAVWYSKPVFGDVWAELAHLSDRRMRQGGPAAILQAFGAALILALALAHMIRVVHGYFGVNDYLADALATSFWVWLGFSATTLVIHNGFEQKRKKLTLLAIGYQFVSIMLMGAIIGLSPNLFR